ncbi:putative low-specificity L-threonine aldolase 1 [Ascosphaera acerosa]|nr:putative low-specificity L-threonine aldolase 1 [Ascosphaera acerosa]
MWVARGGKLAQPVETNMVWLDLDAAVLHYQISEEAIEALTAVTDLALNGAPTTARAS